MKPKPPLALKQAQQSGKLDQFFKEREGQHVGDMAKLEHAIESAVKKPKATPAASRKAKLVG